MKQIEMDTAFGTFRSAPVERTRRTRKRFILEGEWSGYRSSQQRVVHRVVTYQPEKYEHLHSITYTDGTSLFLTLRECKPRERVQEIHGYDSLISDCLHYGVSLVAQLPPCCSRCHRKAAALLRITVPLGTVVKDEWLCDVCRDKVTADPLLTVEEIKRWEAPAKWCATTAATGLSSRYTTGTRSSVSASRHSRTCCWTS